MLVPDFAYSSKLHTSPQHIIQAHLSWWCAQEVASLKEIVLLGL